MTSASGFFFRKTVGNNTVPTWGTKGLVWVMPVLFITAGLFWLATSYSWVSGATETLGTVTKVSSQGIEAASDGQETHFSPEFSYVWTDGSEAIGTLGVSSPAFNFEPGSTYTILFNPSVKGNVRFPGFAFNYLGASVILAIGAMFTLISLVLWLWVKAIARNRDQKER